MRPNIDRLFKKGIIVDGEGMEGTRVYPNLNGERVVRTPATSSSSRKARSRQAAQAEADDGAGDAFSSRRLILLGVLLQPIAFGLVQGAQRIQGSSTGAITGTGGGAIAGLIEDYDQGDAVTSPALELQLISECEAFTESRRSPATELSVERQPAVFINDKQIEELIEVLEERGGTQLAAASANGRWTIPWVGGWERLYASDIDARHMGGPAAGSFRGTYSGRSGTYAQDSARMFVYGPGDSGITIEYLHQAADGSKLLLTRPGYVTNLGGNTFQLDFNQAMNELEVTTEPVGKDKSTSNKLLTGVGMLGGSERQPPSVGLTLRTTYLSERLWVLRDVADNNKVQLFQRTETRSVMDRRGLVAEGQIKPPEDEQVRYGGLLFGDSVQDYGNWDVKQAKALAEKQRLLNPTEYKSDPGAKAGSR